MTKITTVLALPYPVSTNRMYRVANGRPYLTQQARAYKEHVAWLAARAGLRVFHGPVGLHISIRPKLTKKGEPSKMQIDHSNVVKVLEDALQGVWYDNDKQVKQLVVDEIDGVFGGAALVNVWPL